MKAGDLLISTKFAPPRIGPRYIFRRHLLDQLHHSQRSNLILVTGAPGFGKTILLAQWRQELLKSGADVAWLSLSSEDKQPSNFSSYLLAALHELGVPVETDMLLEGDGAVSMDAVVAVATNGAAALGKDLYLIVDDYHYIDDPWAHRLMQRLLDHCPGNLHIAIGSRSVPPFNLGRLRVSGQVAELGSEELPFDLQETRAFFDQNLPGMKLSIDEVQLMHDLTGGWPASLELLAIMLKARPKARGSLRELSWKLSDLQTYLAEDVVAHLPAELITFIEQLSVCRSFNVDLACAVTGNANAASLIQRIEEENLLVVRVESDDRLPWYRFHPLFGEFLAARLMRTATPPIEELHARAGRWFAARGLLVEAVRHATLAGNLEFAVEAIENASPESWDFGYVGPLLNLLDRVPREMLFEHPRLFFIGCLALAMTAHPANAERWIAQMRESGALEKPAIPDEVVLALATLAWRRDDTSRIIELLEPLGKVSQENQMFQYIHRAALGASYAAEGRYEEAYILIDSPLLAAENRKSGLVLQMEQARASILLLEGRVREAAKLAEETLARSEASRGRHSPNANLCATIVGDVYYELDRIDDAREVTANRPRALEWSTSEVMIRAAICRARLDFLQESADTALAFVSSYAAHCQSMGLDRLRAHMLAEQIRILLEIGRRQRANEPAAQLRELEKRHRDSSGSRAEIPAIVDATFARLYLADGRFEDALEALDKVRRYAEKYGRGRLLVRSDLQIAIVLRSRKRGEDAIDAASRAVRRGFQLGLVRTFVDEGKAAAEVLHDLYETRSDLLDAAERTYLATLLDRFDAFREQAADQPATEQAGGNRFNLTPREIEILKLICHAMPNKRIALALNITLETVKWNVKNILAKLGVSNRYDAITRARENRLVE